MDDGVGEAVFKVSESEMLLENSCSVSAEESRREAVLRVCEYERGEASGAASLAGRNAWRSRHSIVKEISI